MEFCGCGDLAQKVDRYKKRKQHVDEVTEGLAALYCLFIASAPPPHCPLIAPFACPRPSPPISPNPPSPHPPPHSSYPAARDLGVLNSAGGLAQGPPRKEHYSPRHQDGQLLSQRRWCVLWAWRRVALRWLLVCKHALGIRAPVAMATLTAAACRQHTSMSSWGHVVLI